MKKIFIIVGTRPNFIKVTQFKRVVSEFYPEKFKIEIIHTGQHYDDKMAKAFFEQFLLYPDHYITISKTSANTQIAEIMQGLEELIIQHSPDLIMAVGDVNSTLAAAITANKTNTCLAHLESGLRSYDRTMPEEINRIITDELSDFYFVTERSGVENLEREGKSRDSIFFVGNTMIDTLVAFEDPIRSSSIINELGLDNDPYILITMHRPATVDNKDGLLQLCEILTRLSKMKKVVFPLHPRTRKNLEKFDLLSGLENENLLLLPPLDYFSFQNLILNSDLVMTDSGGIQEETTFRKIPCITLRPNTERPSTIEEGSNRLTPYAMESIIHEIKSIEDEDRSQYSVPSLWDGKSTNRILKHLDEIL